MIVQVTLSSELYLAPEMMYATLELPGMVKEAIRDMPDHLIKDCLSRVLVTGNVRKKLLLVDCDELIVIHDTVGGNTDLQGFTHRFSSDLRKLMPEHAPIINVVPFPAGNNSWNTVLGANSIKVPPRYGRGDFVFPSSSVP